MKTIYLLFFLLVANGIFAQCDPEVPTYIIDLSANPDTTWVLFESDALDRDGQCCGVPTNENCIKFVITLHPNAAGIFFDYDGAGAFGSLNWREDCGTPHSLKDTICVTDLSFTLTFCKPGSDNGNYTLISVPKPTFPEDQFVPMNCIQPVEVLGVTASTISWQSISPGTPGQYNSYLSCTNCLTPTFTPNPTGPSEIRYRVCGYPVLDYCVGNFNFCDTVKFTIQDSLKLSLSPLQPTFCSGGSTTLTATATGGDGNYAYIWYNSSLQIVGTGSTYSASIAGTYTCEVRDGNYEPGFCDDFFKTVVVVETFPPIINAGVDQVLCATSPNATLIGSYQYAAGIVWSGGAGTFQNGLISDTNIYIPTQQEINNGSVTLTLSSSGVGGGCTNASDQIQLFFVDTVETNLTDLTLLCKNGDVSVNPIITGGVAPFNYSWTNGINSASNTLGEGTHCLTITDGNLCQTTHCLTITAPTSLNLTTSSTPATTNGGNDGTATAAVTGGVGPYSYAWSNGGTTSTISGLTYGIYTVTITDQNGCEREGSVVVNEPRCNGYFVSTSSTNVSCFGGNNGTATATPNNGTGPFLYTWNDISNQSTANATNLLAGIYTVIVTDNSGCIAINTATITEPSELMNSMLHSDVSVQGGNNGSATANPTGGSGVLSYLWSNGSTTNSATGLTAGIYYLTITDGNGCTLEDSVQISEPPCNEFYALINTVSPLCNGASTAQAQMTLLNGVGPYSIVWSTGQTNTQSITNISAGFHSVEITDARGCEIFQTYGISQPSTLSLGLSPTPSTCTGDDNGTIDLSVTGGTYPYYYFNWSNGATTEDQIGLEPGSYSVTVQDENGCQATSSTSLVEPAVLSVTNTHVNATCFGYSDASIDVNVMGGTTPYSYSWSNGAITQDLAGIDLGGYILTVTDANYCSPNLPLTVLIEQPSMVEAQSITVACPTPGASTAQVTIAPIGGNPNYAISFDGGTTYGSYGTYSSNMGVDASYTILVKDINNCTSISNPISIDSNVSINAAVFNECYVVGQTQETVSVSTIGGSPAYSLSYDNGVTYQAPGVSVLTLPINTTYQLVAMDDNGCLSVPYSVLLPNVFNQTTSINSSYNGSNISCFGLTDGQAISVPTGGAAPYSYTWSNGQTSAVATSLGAGTYTVQVSDANGCTISGSITLNNPPLLQVSTAITSNYSGQNISCFGASTGNALATATGGIGTYTYAWSNGVMTPVLPNVQAGTYTVIATDANGCNAGGSVTLNQPPMLTQSVSAFTYTSGTNISCNGENDGTVDLTVGGGTPGYSYLWSNGSLTQDISGLVAGTYSVTITDQNGCSIPATISLSEPTVLTQTISSSTYPSGTNISCFGENDGNADLTISGGSAPYSYIWSNGSFGQDLSGLIAGTYSVTATDQNGCAVLASITLTEPTVLAGSSISYLYPGGTNISCNDLNDGSIDITISGGNTPYTYLWSNGATSQDVSGLASGPYNVQITDFNGCAISLSSTLTQPDTLSVAVAPTDVSCDGGNNGFVDATVTGGVQPYSYVWSNGAISEDIGGLGVGNYTLSVTDANGCIYAVDESLTAPTVLELSLEIDSVSCYGFSDGSIDLTVIGGATPYNFTWSNGATTEDISTLTQNEYHVTVVDANGCFNRIYGNVEQPDTILITGIITDPSCFGFTNGSINTSVTGGTLPYAYSWSNSTSQSDPTDLVAGMYELTLMDINGCVAQQEFVLDQPDLLVIDLTSPVNFHGHNVSLNGANDGSIDLTVAGGTSPYLYDWSNNDDNEDLDGLTAGIYTVTVIDAQGCLISDTIELTQPFELEIPTAFTPNEDGFNDVFDIHGIEAYPDNELTVVNRWGNVVYTEEKYHNTWKGTHKNGEELPDGVYFVILKINGGEIEKNTYVHIKKH
jgi:gliding motility-associated-like protein